MSHRTRLPRRNAPTAPCPAPATVTASALRFAAPVALSIILASTAMTKAAHAEAPDGVPDGAIFGFSEPTDIGKPGDSSLGVELTNISGKGAGSYSASSLKNRLSVTFAEGWEASIAAFASHHHIRRAPDYRDNDRTSFDGGSLEIAKSLLPRSAGAPFAVTLISEFYAGANDAGTGLSGRSLNLETRLAIDAALVPGKVFGAINLLYNIGAQDDGGKPFHHPTSGYGASAALTWRLNPWLFVGVESRLDVAYDSAFFGKRHGWAIFVGPTAAIRMGEGVLLTAVWTPQARGGGHGAHGGRSLDAHGRNLARLALSVDF